MLKQKKRRV